MSWFTRVREFIEEDDAQADDVDTEFDNVAEALNGLLQGARVAASEDKTLSTSVVDVPGASASIVAARASKLLVITNFQVYCPSAGFVLPHLYLNVDGSNQATEASGYLTTTAASSRQHSQSYVLKLGAGSHTVKLQAKMDAGSPSSCKVVGAATGFSYILFPDPEP